MLPARLDLSIKRLDKHSAIKGATNDTIQSLYSHTPCEMCGDFSHSGNDCLKTQVDVWYNNYNGFSPQGDPGWNQLHPQNQEGNYAHSNFANQILENINSNLEGLTFSFQNQLSLNKMFETHLAQFATTIPTYDFKNILGQPKI